MSTPQPDESGSLVPNVYTASIVSIVISGLFFAARIVSKRLQRQGLNSSDYVLMVSLVCSWGLAIVNIWMTTVGLGTHFTTVMKNDPDLSGTILMLKVFIVDEIFYDVGIASVKVSILLLYRSIFTGRGFAIATWTLIGIVCAWCLGNLLPSIFSCRPISGFWDLTMSPPPVCINKEILYIVGSTINVATDVAILCLPIGKILGLQLSRRNKVGVIAVFLLGGLVCVVSIYRFTVLVRANSPDLTWEFANVLNWSAVEVATAVASACLPLMRPLLVRVIPRSFMRSTAGTHSHPTGNNTYGGGNGNTTKPKGSALGRSAAVNTFGTSSEVERLTEDQVMGKVSGWCEPEVHDVDPGVTTPNDGITVTKTFEMSTMTSERNDRDPRVMDYNHVYSPGKR